MEKMLVSHLVDYGVPAMIVESWRKRIGEELLPLQEEAVIRRGLLSGRSLVIEAPTSAGKTFCAEMAAAAAIFRRRKVFMLVPLKAIASERYDDFQRKYGSLGIRIAISSGDHHDDDLKIRRGEFDVAILIYEKFNQLLLRQTDLLNSVELVVVDELQMLADRDRGALLELALLKLLQSSSKPQLLGLTTSAANSAEIANWLGCDLLKTTSRPTELRQGVLLGRSFKSLNFNDKQQSEEVLLQREPCETEERLLQTVETISASGELVLVFVRSKRAAEYLAERLSERRSWVAENEMVRALEEKPPSLLRDKLMAAAGSGVAFHHADLAPGLRAIVENFFREKVIKIVFTTTTLAFGVNLPADSVVVDAYKFESGSQQGQATVVPLNWREYEAMSGRAGRFGHCKGVGRSLLLAESRVEAESLWRLYVSGGAAPIQSQLGFETLADIALDLFAAKTVDSLESLKVALESTLAAREGTVWQESQIESAIAVLFEHRLLKREDETTSERIPETMSPTSLGEACKRQGLSVAGIIRLTQFLGSEECLDRLSWLYVAVSLPEAARIPVYVTYREEQERRWRKALEEYLRASEAGFSDRPGGWLRRLVEREHILSREERRQLKAALALNDWCEGEATIRIESRYAIHSGALLQASETTGWLLRAAAECARTLNCSEKLSNFLIGLAADVARGHSYSDSILTRIFTAAEERDLVIRLAGAGLGSQEAITAAPVSQISEIVGVETAKRIKDLLKVILEEQNSVDFGKEVEMPLLRLRGSLQGDRVPIRYADEVIDLTPKSFSYLFKLSAWRLLRPDGWVNKDEIEPGFNQAKNIYRVKQELKRFATGLEKLIENNKSGCYRINLKPEQIRIDYDSMESFCDMELIDLSRQLQQRLAS